MDWKQCSFSVCFWILFRTTGPRVVPNAGHRKSVGKKPTNEEVQMFGFHHGISIEISPDQADLPMFGAFLAMHGVGVIPSLEVFSVVQLLQ